MKPVFLVSEGSSVGELNVPAFELCRGDILCLHMPSPIEDAPRDRLVRALTGEQPVPGIRPFCRVYNAEHAMNRRFGAFRLFRRMRITEWLQAEVGISEEAAHRIREECGRIMGEKDFSGNLPISHIPGDARAILGLQAAWAAGAETVVFHLIGLGPLTQEKCHEAILTRLDRCAAIQLNYEHICQGQIGRDCMPGARCIELTRHPAGLTTRQSA